MIRNYFMLFLSNFAGNVGKSFLAIAFDAGGYIILMGRALSALFPPRIDIDEFFRCINQFGIRSLPIIMATAGFVGSIIVLQSALYVKMLGANSLVGWFTGMSVMREVGPVFIALMFSGRVGANNTAELASMTVTEQITALKVLAIDPYGYLVIPRLFAMMLTLAGLVIFGDLAALISGAIAAYSLLGVPLDVFYSSFITYNAPIDFIIGVFKAIVFGFVIAITSSHYGLSASKSAQAVGKAVNAQVVASAVLVFVMDYIMTSAVH